MKRQVKVGRKDLARRGLCCNPAEFTITGQLYLTCCPYPLRKINVRYLDIKLRLSRLLSNVRRGAIFERATIGHLRAFAGATLLSTLLAIVEPPLRTLVLQRLFGAPLSRYAIGFDSAQLMLVLVCALFFLVTNLLHEARRLAEENQGFV